MPSPRLTKTAVQEAVRRTRSTPCVRSVANYEETSEGGREVRMALVDAFDDPREESPAIATLITDLESQGWTVRHRRFRVHSHLIVAEPTT